MFELTEEDETYSTIFKALKHPIRREIMRMLRGDGVAYSEMLEALSIESGHLNYHLEAMRDLISKTEEGRYRLSSLGRAALGLMEGVEEPRRETMKLSGYRRKMLALASLLIIAPLLFGGISLHYYLESGSLRSELDQLRSEYTMYRDQFGNELTILTPVQNAGETYFEMFKVKLKTPTPTPTPILPKETLWILITGVLIIGIITGMALEHIRKH